MNRRRSFVAAGLAVVVVLSLLLLLWPQAEGPRGRLGEYLEDLAHFPVFAAACILLRLLLPKGRRFDAVAIAAGGLAALGIEWLQPLVGRMESARDLLLGLAGSAAGVALAAAARTAVPRVRFAFVALVLMLALAAVLPLAVIAGDAWLARRQYPQLGGFESAMELGRWQSDDCALSRVPEHAAEGRYALRITVTNAVPYPGAFLQEGPPAWHGLRSLCVDVFLAGTEARGLWMRIDDRKDPPYGDRVQEMVVLKPGPNSLCWDRERVTTTPSGRHLDLEHIVSVGLFFDQAPADAVLYLDNLRLVVN